MSKHASYQQILRLTTMKDLHSYAFWMKDGSLKELTNVNGTLYHNGNDVTDQVDEVFYWVDSGRRRVNIL